MFCLLATCALMTSCKKDQGPITLSAELETVGNSKVHMENLYPTWDNGDAVWVNGYQEAVTVNGNNASIQIADDHGASGRFLAVYPYNSVKVADETTVTITIPTTQEWAEDASHNQKINMPMAASTTNSTLKFRNLCSLMKVTVQNETGEDITLYNVTLTATTNDVFLSGSAAINKTDIGPGLTPALSFTSGCNMVTLKGINASIPNGGSKVVYIVVPTFTNSTTMEIEIYTSKGVQHVTGSNPASMNRNKLATATFQTGSTWSWTGTTNGHEWVILWPGGPKWAKRNVGADADGERGLYFSWGTTTGYNKNGTGTYSFVTGNYPSAFGTPNTGGVHNWSTATTLPYDPSTYILKPEYDAARANWGGNWRMPTKEEIVALMGCSQSNGGRTFTHSSGRSITLPAAGFFRGGSVRSDESHDYWSSTRNSDGSSGRSGQIYDIYINRDNGSWRADLGNNASPWIGEPVRAVCD